MVRTSVLPRTGPDTSLVSYPLSLCRESPRQQRRYGRCGAFRKPLMDEERGTEGLPERALCFSRWPRDPLPRPAESSTKSYESNETAPPPPIRERERARASDGHPNASSGREHRGKINRSRATATPRDVTARKRSPADGYSVVGARRR